MQKYLVLIFEEGQWVENGDGPMSLKTAERVSREIRRECGCRTRVVPAESFQPKTERCPECHRETEADSKYLLCCECAAKSEYNKD